MLTAIVIGFALICFALVLVLRLIQVADTDDAVQLRHAEPRPDDPVKPPTPPLRWSRRTRRPGRAEKRA